MLAAIIVAAGSSRRAGFDKLAAALNGRPVLAYSLAAFDACQFVNQIVVVARRDREDEMRTVCQEAGLRQAVTIAPGGERRQDSVAAGLWALSDETKFVAVHDAARPLVTAKLIGAVFAKARETGAASAAEPVNDTLKRVDSHLAVTESIDRREVFAMQTPQIFERVLLEQAYRNITALGEAITDEVSAVQQLGRKVTLVPNDEANFKITRARDLAVAELVLRSRC